MRKLILLLLFPLLSFSQGEIRQMGKSLISLEKKGNTYIMVYKDMKYSQIDEYKSFSFTDDDNLYDIILNGMETLPEQDIVIELENDILHLHFGKTFGKAFVEIFHNVNKIGDVIGKSTWLDKKKLDKLFGKRS